MREREEERERESRHAGVICEQPPRLQKVDRASEEPGELPSAVCREQGPDLMSGGEDEGKRTEVGCELTRGLMEREGRGDVWTQRGNPGHRVQGDE